jgi:hypothetical protein
MQDFTHFRLIGQTTVFKVARLFGMFDHVSEQPGAIDCVIGITLDGKFTTRARIADVTPITVGA